jgi:hypothetical protein
MEIRLTNIADTRNRDAPFSNKHVVTRRDHMEKINA